MVRVIVRISRALVISMELKTEYIVRGGHREIFEQGRPKENKRALHKDVFFKGKK